MSELDYLTGRLKKGAISRREFMGRAVALGASTAAISSMLASVDAYAAETPKKGGTLRLGLGGGSTTDSIDVGSYTDSVMIDTGHGLFNGIVEWGEDGKPKPDLASSWEPKNGAKDWVFNLRKGVKFSNGKEFTADDAIYSLNYHRGDSKSGGKPALSAVTDVKKLDKYQIQISLAAADADLPYSLTDYHILMVPDGFKDWANPVGTGAFLLEKFDPGVRIALKKNPDYWKEGRGHLDAAEITVISDFHGALQRAEVRADRHHQPRRSQGGRPARKIWPEARSRARRLSRRGGDASRQGALRQSRSPPRAEIRHRSRADPESPVQRLRNDRQRPSDSADRSFLQQRTAAAQARSRAGEVPLQEGGPHRSEDSPARFRTRRSTGRSTWDR